MNAVSVDLDMLEQLPAKTLLRLLEQRQATAKNFALISSTVQELSPLFRFLEEQDIDARFDLTGGWIDVQFTGDGQRLGRVWGELRRTGYKTEHRPKKGDTTVSTYWSREGYARIWMMFSSSVCKRVQVGTETKEVPVYQTVCDELPGIEQLESELPALSAPTSPAIAVEEPPGAAVADDNIPF